jgi:hypothetical protein
MTDHSSRIFGYCVIYEVALSISRSLSGISSTSMAPTFVRHQFHVNGSNVLFQDEQFCSAWRWHHPGIAKFAFSIVSLLPIGLS